MRQRFLLLIICSAVPVLSSCSSGKGSGATSNNDGVVRVSSAVTLAGVVTPLAACVAKISGTVWQASFGYESTSTRPILLAVGAQNTFSPSPAGRGQPERFDPGRHKNAFSITFNGTALTWTLSGKSVTVSSTSLACPTTINASAPVLGSFVLYARSAIRMDRATVLGGDVGVAVGGEATDGRDELSIEPNGIIDPTHAVFARTVDLRSRAVVGAVFSTRVDNQGATTGPIGPFPAAAMPALPVLTAATPGTTPVTVAATKTLSLGAGSYGLIHVDGTLTLTGGTYQISSLELGTGGRLEASAGVRLRVAGSISANANSHIRTNPVGVARDFLIEVTGGASPPAAIFQADTEVHAIVLAPTGQIVFHPRCKATGAFVAHDFVLTADANIQYENGVTLPLSQCIASMQLAPEDMPAGQDPNTLPRMIAATACFAPDRSTCEITFLATVNFDQRTAAKQVLADTFSPAQYLWIVRDRSRKLRLARKDPTFAPAFCRGDADGDLIPDDRDACPNTPPLTATDDRGCTNSTLPTGPSRTGVQAGLAGVGLLISKTCDGLPQPLPPFVVDVCLDRPHLRYLITVAKAVNQPDRCSVWYEMKTSGVEQFEPRETFTARLAFEKGQAVAQTATTYTFAEPLVCDPTVETPGDGKSWPCDEVNGDAFDTVIAVRATNGNGQQSQWGTAQQTPFHLCK